MPNSIQYQDHFESRLKGRYVAPKHLTPILESLPDLFRVSIIGQSEKGLDIHNISIGSGKKVVLAWSQMHGNESTTTKALFDFYHFLGQKQVFQKEIETFLETYTFHCIPILNPDGAKNYTRENSNGVDLNRDAQDRSQNESRALATLFDSLQPHLCLNLHDQRTLYSLPDDHTATVSFLAPAANAERTITAAREEAMKLITAMSQLLQEHIPGKVGRYDDSFNIECVGDTFQNAGVPTILFEAGHYPQDYERTRSRECIFYAFLELFGIDKTDEELEVDDYFKIPQNEKKFRDVILRNISLEDNSETTSIAINFEEVLENDAIRLVPKIEEMGDLSHLIGHEEIDGGNSVILLNSYENVFVGGKVSTIVDKNAINTVFFKDSCNII